MPHRITLADVAAFAGRTPVLRSTAGKLVRPLVVNRKAMHKSLFFKMAGRRVPLIPLATASGQLTGYSIREMFTSADAMFETVCAAIFRFKLDAMMVVADFTVDPEAMGCELRFPDHELPSVRTHFVHTMDDIAGLRPVDPYKDGRMPVFIEVISRLTKKFSLLMGSGSCGPFTCAAELAGVEDFAMRTITEPEFVEKLMDYCAGQIIRYNQAQIKAGSDVVVVSEPSASILSPKAFERFAVPCIKRIIQALDRPVVLHICGNVNHLVELIAACNPAAISFDAPVDLAQAAKRVPKTMILAGNIDPVSVMDQMDPEGIRKAVTDMLESMRDAPFYIPASGCDIMPRTPLKNLDAFLETVKNWR